MIPAPLSKSILAVQAQALAVDAALAALSRAQASGSVDRIGNCLLDLREALDDIGTLTDRAIDRAEDLKRPFWEVGFRARDSFLYSDYLAFETCVSAQAKAVA